MKANSPASQPGRNTRLLSLDALRGFDMLMISGAGGFLVSLKGKTGLQWVDTISEQMTHASWNGFTFYDFIFPLFLFIAGVSLSYSINSSLSKGLGKSAIYKKALKRMGILIVLGIFYKNDPVTFFDPQHIRIVSVLGRIGFACFITVILYLNFTRNQRVFWILGILLAYFAALFLIPVPGFGRGDLSFEGNLVGWFDRNFLPGRLIQKTYDENGILTQFPALCLTVFGTLAGDILRSSVTEGKKLLMLFIIGVVCIGAGLLWGVYFPINKHLWSSSFILLTAGLAFLSLDLFFGIIDVMRWKKWAFFLKVIGLNSLAIYLGFRFINFGFTSRTIFSGLYAPLPEIWHPVFEGLGALILVWLFLYFLYRKKWFLKI